MIVAVVFGEKPLAGGEFAGKPLAGISLGYTKIWTAPLPPATVVITALNGSGTLSFSGDATGTLAITGSTANWQTHVDTAGNLYVVSRTLGDIIRIDATTGEQTPIGFTGITNGTSGPTGMCIDSAGNIYIADTIRARIVKRAPDGTQTTITAAAVQLYCAPDDTIYFAEGLKTYSYITPGTTNVTTKSSAGLTSYTVGICGDGNNGLYITQSAQPVVVHLDENGISTTSLNIPGTSNVKDVHYDPATGLLYIASYGNSQAIIYNTNDGSSSSSSSSGVTDVNVVTLTAPAAWPP